MASDFDAVIGPLTDAITAAGHAWRKHAGIDDRKTFAGEVKAMPFASALFRMFTDRPDGDPAEHVDRHVRGMTTAAILRAIGKDGAA